MCTVFENYGRYERQAMKLRNLLQLSISFCSDEVERPPIKRTSGWLCPVPMARLDGAPQAGKCLISNRSPRWARAALIALGVGWMANESPVSAATLRWTGAHPASNAWSDGAN